MLTSISGFFWDKFTRLCIGCSSSCEDSCDPTTGGCTLCADRYFGPQCLSHCSVNNCKSCYLKNDIVACLECEQGYYPGNKECRTCDDRHCINNNCSPTDGTCSDGCQVPWFGINNMCDKKCTFEHCTQCASTSIGVAQCVRCESRYHVAQNHRSCILCASQCLNQICNDKSGNCTECVPGYYGSQCKNQCSSDCLNGICAQQNGYCICKEGKFGMRCDRDCPMTCSSCINYRPGLCQECDAGTYGDMCEKECSKNCEYTSYSYQHCDKVTGKCRDGCRSGYYGDLCTQRCERCLGSCVRETGVCTSGCSHSYYGAKCDIPCPSNCQYITSGYQRTCDMSGLCSLGCLPGYHGDFCNLTCSSNCIDNACDRNGECTEGCRYGYKGRTCDVACVGDCKAACSDNCLQDICDTRTLTCSLGCPNGWYGATCDKLCDGDCVTGKCNQTTGACEGNCRLGYYGEYCNQQCNYYCMQKECERFSGNLDMF